MSDDQIESEIGIIRPEFMEYLKSQGYSEENIFTAWAKVCKVYTHESTREILTRDLLEGKEVETVGKITS